MDHAAGFFVPEARPGRQKKRPAGQAGRGVGADIRQGRNRGDPVNPPEVDIKAGVLVRHKPTRLVTFRY